MSADPSPGTVRVERSGLRADARLAAFLEEEALPAAGVDPSTFWDGLALLVDRLAPRNRELLAERERLQTLIDQWHRDHAGRAHDTDAYQAFLREIGYLVEAGPAFTIETTGVDPEIATIAGPQLVVPASNARYALNAANARWGSLYDALYGTDALGTLPPPGPYDPARGAAVVAWARDLLDRVVPLRGGSHAGATSYAVRDGRLQVGQPEGGTAELADPAVLTGHAGDPESPDRVLLTHHGLGIEIVLDRHSEVGRADAAGVSDVRLEAAVTTIVDFEDSVAAVDGADKAACYRAWLGLLAGDLSAEVDKDGRTFTRRLTPPRTVTGPDGREVVLRPQALLLARNVGLLMTTPAVLDAAGREIPEGLLDALVTVTCALVDVGPDGPRRNSPAGSVYVVKPKMHGPAEVAFAVDTFALVEQVLGLPENTVKIGIMDEERRTTVNLAACVRAASARLAFINTGFLDRTGDEIHTSMEAGPVVRKAAMKAQPWIGAYEDWNVDVGLACGLPGRAQVGKGMWAAPDLMHDMLAQKGGQPQAGASCAWVPSPTAATLHATHYHLVDVARRQEEIAAGGRRAGLDAILTMPVDAERAWDDEEVDEEVANNAQSILGYVVRWVDQGVGCSKVPDIHDVNLMEDRATCRISSQHIANWLHHGVVDRDRVEAILRRTADLVDRQNAGDPAYVPMGPSYDGDAFRAARELVFHGRSQPSGYTEPLLHAARTRVKG